MAARVRQGLTAVVPEPGLGDGAVSWNLLADLVVVLHAAFVAFVAGGGLLVWRWPRVAWVHLPCAAWGVAVELAGWVCPLTPLEHAWRARAGRAAYTGDFVGRYVLPALYPEGLTRASQIGLGVAALAVNVAAYGCALRRARRRTGRS